MNNQLHEVLHCKVTTDQNGKLYVSINKIVNSIRIKLIENNMKVNDE